LEPDEKCFLAEAGDSFVFKRSFLLPSAHDVAGAVFLLRMAIVPGSVSPAAMQKIVSVTSLKKFFNSA
jgi:hypothetical protein